MNSFIPVRDIKLIIKEQNLNTYCPSSYFYQNRLQTEVDDLKAVINAVNDTMDKFKVEIEEKVGKETAKVRIGCFSYCSNHAYLDQSALIFIRFMLAQIQTDKKFVFRHVGKIEGCKQKCLVFLQMDMLLSCQRRRLNPKL